MDLADERRIRGDQAMCFGLTVANSSSISDGRATVAVLGSAMRFGVSPRRGRAARRVQVRTPTTTSAVPTARRSTLSHVGLFVGVESG